MRKNISSKKNTSLKEASAYKTRAQGRAELVKAWMPLMLLVTAIGALAIALICGVDVTQLVPVVPIFQEIAKK
ncbi:hypothetical protein [Bacillus marasmi]|uniref:hypothetical protein n=1 Tax=Bacillus marasmi TaxID=1926279 RepID=UPI0011C96321|nr:hypothetical protein [Bacillus marasmi]